jgi:gluconolactonase
MTFLTIEAKAEARGGRPLPCTRAPIHCGWRAAGVLLLASMAAWGQDFSKIQIEKVAAGFAFTEGAVWSRDGYLLFSDVPNNRILRFEPGKGHSVYREESNGANGNTFDRRGRLYTCESRTRRVTRTDKKGKIEVLAEKWMGKRLNAPNDIVVRHDEHVYFTDPAFGSQAENRELDFYGVYHINLRGQMELVARPTGRPNGIALSPDGKILYVANSDERNLRAYDLDQNGAASNESVLVSGIEGVPDGIKVDERGNIYVTAKGIAVYTPKGKLLTTIELQETPANCAFGDRDLGSLYVTARTSLYRVRLDVKGAVQY